MINIFAENDARLRDIGSRRLEDGQSWASFMGRSIREPLKVSPRVA